MHSLKTQFFQTYSGEGMGYFDKLTEAVFKKTSDGVDIYYPNGAMGKGRLVSDQALKDKLYKHHKLLMKTVMFIVLPYSWLIGLSGEFTLTTVSPILVLASAMYIKQHLMIRNLPKHNLKLGFKEAMVNGSKALPGWYPWLLGSISTICLMFSLSLPFLTNKKYADHIDIVIGLSLFSLALMMAAIKIHRGKALNK